MDQKTLHLRTEEHFEVRPCGDNNPKFSPKAKPCNRCGETVAGQRLTLIKKFYEYREQFWEIKCNSCDLKMTVKDLAKFKKE
jgi:ribosomal protein S27E